MEAIDFCTKEETEILLRSAKSVKHKVLLLLMADAGLRVSEARTLPWSAFDFRNKTLTVRSLKKRGEEKKRTIPVSDRLAAALVDFLNKSTPEGKEALLFPSQKDKSKPIGRSAVNQMFYRIKAEKPEVGRIYPHKLRHTFATNLRANNASLEDIKDLLGHGDLNTTLIYAHADTTKLRELVNASKPKETLPERLKKVFFKVQQRRINYSFLDSRELIGRETEARQITDLVNRNISVLITGAIGTGKSKLLESLNFQRPVLEMEDTKDFKKSLANILLFLFQGEKEQVLKLLFPDTTPGQAVVKVNKESIPALCKLLVSVTQKHEYVLKIGDIDTITPGVVKALEMLKDHFTIVTTARALKMQSAGFIWNFERVELQNLSRPNTLRLVHNLTSHLEVESPEHLRNKVWDISQGNPRMVQELCGRFEKEPVLDPETVGEIAGNYIGKQTKEIDMSILLLICFACLAMFRYLGHETGQPSMRFIGGCFMILLMFGRVFFKSGRRKLI